LAARPLRAGVHRRDLGRSNFGPNIGQTDTVEQAEFRRQDRRTALKIILLSLLIGAIVAAAAYFIPL
jgi:hypothetical protein